MNAPDSGARVKAHYWQFTVIAALPLAWVVVLFVAFRPGMMSPDSINQYLLGLSRAYRNLHPPLICWLNGVSARTVHSPWPVLLGQLAVLSGAMTTLVLGIRGRRRALAATLLVLFLVLPTTWAIAVVLWKDVLMSAALLMGIVLLRYERPVAALALFLLSTAFRHNAVFAAMPLAIMAATMIHSSRGTRAAVAAAAVCALFAGPKLVDVVFHAKDDWIVGQMFAHDLAAVYVAHPEEYGASIFASDAPIQRVKAAYSPECLVALLFARDRPIAFESLPERKSPLVREWLREISRHPRAYARHRLAAFSAALGVHGTCYPFHTTVDPNPWGLKPIDHTWLHRGLRAVEERYRDSWMFRGWTWLVAITAVFAVSVALRAWLASAVALSGITYSLAYLVIAACCDFRYMYWTAVATFASSLLLLHSRQPREDPARG